MVDGSDLAQVLHEASDIAQRVEHKLTSTHVLLALFTVENRAQLLLREKGVNEDNLLEQLPAHDVEQDGLVRTLCMRAREIAQSIGSRETDCLHLLVAFTRVPCTARELLAKTCPPLMNLANTALSYVVSGSSPRRYQPGRVNVPLTMPRPSWPPGASPPAPRGSIPILSGSSPVSPFRASSRPALSPRDLIDEVNEGVPRGPEPMATPSPLLPEDEMEVLELIWSEFKAHGHWPRKKRLWKQLQSLGKDLDALARKSKWMEFAGERVAVGLKTLVLLPEVREILAPFPRFMRCVAECFVKHSGAKKEEEGSRGPEVTSVEFFEIWGDEVNARLALKCIHHQLGWAAGMRGSPESEFSFRPELRILRFENVETLEQVLDVLSATSRGEPVRVPEGRHLMLLHAVYSSLRETKRWPAMVDFAINLRHQLGYIPDLINELTPGFLRKPGSDDKSRRIRLTAQAISYVAGDTGCSLAFSIVRALVDLFMDAESEPRFSINQIADKLALPVERILPMAMILESEPWGQVWNDSQMGSDWSIYVYDELWRYKNVQSWTEYVDVRDEYSPERIVSVGGSGAADLSGSSGNALSMGSPVIQPLNAVELVDKSNRGKSLLNGRSQALEEDASKPVERGASPEPSTAAAGASQASAIQGTPHAVLLPEKDVKKVFIIHGRETSVLRELKRFLSALGLRAWTFADESHEVPPNTHIAEIISRGVSKTKAVIALFTPDEFASLASDLRQAGEPERESRRWQPRPNVLYEAGMAMGLNQNGTILVSIGNVELPSDLAGILSVRLNNETKFSLRRRLIQAGCAVDLERDEWADAAEGGNFNAPPSRKMPADPFSSDS